MGKRNQEVLQDDDPRSKKKKQKKEKLRKKKSKGKAEKKAKAGKTEATSSSSPGAEVKTAPPKPRINFDERNLHCAVCFDFPEKEIYQCSNGHLMCDECHHHIIQGGNPFCPNCRVRLSRERKYRNRFAEVVLASLMVDCKNEGCEEKVQYGKLKEHCNTICGFRKIRCKYHLLGCSWEGIHNNLKHHHKECKLREANSKDILKNVIARKQKEEADVKASQAGLLAQKAVCDLLSSHCADISIRDVMIEKDDICEEMCSKTFTAFGLAWEVVLVPPTTPDDQKKVGVKLRVVSSIKRRVRMKFFALPGPGIYSAYQLTPTIHKVVFKRNKIKESQVCYLGFAEKDGKAVNELDSIHLRIGLIDTRRKPTATFSTIQQSGGDNSYTRLGEEGDDENEFSGDDSSDYTTSSGDSSPLYGDSGREEEDLDYGELLY